MWVTAGSKGSDRSKWRLWHLLSFVDTSISQCITMAILLFFLISNFASYSSGCRNCHDALDLSFHSRLFFEGSHWNTLSCWMSWVPWSCWCFHCLVPSTQPCRKSMATRNLENFQRPQRQKPLENASTECMFDEGDDNMDFMDHMDDMDNMGMVFWHAWTYGPQMTNGCDFAESKLQGRDLWLWNWCSLAGSCVEASGARLFCRCFASKEKWKGGKTAANPCFSMVILRYSEIVLRYLDQLEISILHMLLRMIPLNIERLCGAQLSYWGFGCNLWSLLFWQGVWCLLYRQKQRCFAWV